MNPTRPNLFKRRNLRQVDRIQVDTSVVLATKVCILHVKEHATLRTDCDMGYALNAAPVIGAPVAVLGIHAEGVSAPHLTVSVSSLPLIFL